MKAGGFNMAVAAVLFFCAVVMMAGAVIVYEKASDNSYEKVVTKFNEVKGDLNTTQAQLERTIEAHNNLETQYNAANLQLNDLVAKYNVLQEVVGKIDKKAIPKNIKFDMAPIKFEPIKVEPLKIDIIRQKVPKTKLPEGAKPLGNGTKALLKDSKDKAKEISN